MMILDGEQGLKRANVDALVSGNIEGISTQGQDV